MSLVIHAGNDKDDPLEIPTLLAPLAATTPPTSSRDRAISAAAGSATCRPIASSATRIVHPLIFSLAARKRVTESTNGFRAFRTAILRDPRIDWRQDWLDRYELEPYLMLKAIRLGYRHVEVPVTKIYPPHEQGYTKMRPFIDWWSIMRPVVYLGLGLKK